MILCLDIGNSQIFGGVFAEDGLKLRFRHNTKHGSTSDEIGIFLKNVLRENDVNPEEIKQVSICSVVPSLDYSIRAACMKYFNIEPFMLAAGVKTGLKVKTRNPQETGSDLMAGAIAGIDAFPNQNLIIADFGTITTYTIISANKEFLGAIFMPGIKLAMDALGDKAAKLFSVEILKPEIIVGRSTIEAIQSGLYFSQLGTLREVINLVQNEAFHGESSVVIGTGGFSYLFQDEDLFDTIMPDLLLHGLRIALEKNL